jgi:ferritin
MKLVRRIAMCTALSLAGLATLFAQQVQTDFDHRADFFQYKTVLASAGLLALAAAIVLRVAAQKMV